MSRAEDVNILTVTRRGLRWRIQLGNFWLARRPTWVAVNLVNRHSLLQSLKRLDFIHSCEWARLGSFPQLPGVAPEDSGYRWVLFVSNFNGGWRPYRDSFMEAFTRGITTIWGQSVDFPWFPGPASRYATEDWSETRLPPSLHYYCAYPGASCHDVRSALRVRREVTSFFAVRRAARPSVAGFAPGLADAGRLLHRLQNCLGEQRPVTEDTPVLGPATATGMTNVVSAAPVNPGQEDAIRALIAAIPRGSASPFASLPGTHFGRLVLIDRQRDGSHPSAQVPLVNSWLVLAADFDAHVAAGEASARRPPDREVRRYFDSIAAQASLAEVWAHCQGRETAPDLTSYLLSTTVDRLLNYRDYPDVTLHDVFDALTIQDLVRRALHGGGITTDAELEALEERVRGIAAAR